MWTVILKRGPLEDLVRTNETLKGAQVRAYCLSDLHGNAPVEERPDQVIVVDASKWYDTKRRAA